MTMKLTVKNDDATRIAVVATLEPAPTGPSEEPPEWVESAKMGTPAETLADPKAGTEPGGAP